MTDDLNLRLKWTFRAHGRQIVLVKRPVESTRHVLMKAFLWALYLPQYPQTLVEVPHEGRYRPDLIAVDESGRPTFWGECGHVGKQKMQTLLRKYRATHFALARWAQPFAQAVELAERCLDGARRTAPFDILVFPDDAAERFITPSGQIEVAHGLLEWQRLE